MSANMVKKGASASSLKERNCRQAIQGPQIDVQELAPTNSFRDIAVSNTFGKITQHKCPGTLSLVKWPSWALLVGHMAKVATRHATRRRAVLLYDIDVSPIGGLVIIDLGIRLGFRIVWFKFSRSAIRSGWSVLWELALQGLVCFNRSGRCSLLLNRSIILAEKLFTLSIRLSRNCDPGQGQYRRLCTYINCFFTDASSQEILS